MTIGQISDIETAKNVKVVNADPIHVLLDNLTGSQSLLTDDISGALVAVDFAHHEIHEGDTFQVSYKSPDASPIGDNATVILVLTTTTKTAHLVFDGAAGGDFEGEFREGVTVTTGGTNLTPQNKNRTFPNNNTVTVVRDPTVSDAGVLLENAFIPGGTGPTAAGGVGSGRSEWILKKNTKYMLRMTNRAGTNQPMSVRAEWYEE